MQMSSSDGKDAMPASPPDIRGTSDRFRPISRPVCILLMVWMLCVMLLSWVVHHGPILSSILKRVFVLRAWRDEIIRFFGG
jgi:hypothetical protein